MGGGGILFNPEQLPNENKPPPPKYGAKWREMTNYSFTELQNFR